ncbi:MAG: methyltransferase [Bacteroidota bacterium]
MEGAFLIPAAVFVACLGMRNMYELLKESRKITAQNRAAFVVVFLSMCALWVCWFILCPADPYRVEVPGPVRGIALTLVGGGTVLAVGALLQLRGVENIEHLVTRGLFRRVRHPMYCGFVAWILGWGIYHGALAGLGIGALGIASIVWWRHLEDARLEMQFGSRYREYRNSTWF